MELKGIIMEKSTQKPLLKTIEYSNPDSLFLMVGPLAKGHDRKPLKSLQKARKLPIKYLILACDSKKGIAWERTEGLGA